MTSMNDIKWPVLRFGSPNCSALKYSDPKQFVLATYSGIKQFRGMTEYYVIDSSGRRFDFDDLHPIKKIGRLKAILYHIFNPVIKIDFGKIIIRGDVSLNELKARMKNDFDEHDDVWSDYGEINGLKIRVDACSSHREVIEMFG